MKLIDDWHQAWKWLSVQFVASAAAFQLAFLAFPAELKPYIPETWMHGIAIALLAAAVLGRLVDQGNVARDTGKIIDQGEHDWETGKTNK